MWPLRFKISHGCLVLLSPKEGELCSLLCISPSLPPGTWKFQLYLLPAIDPWLALLTDQEPTGEQDLSVKNTLTMLYSPLGLEETKQWLA